MYQISKVQNMYISSLSLLGSYACFVQQLMDNLTPFNITGQISFWPVVYQIFLNIKDSKNGCHINTAHISQLGRYTCFAVG